MQADWSVILSTIAIGAAGLVAAFFAGATSYVKAWFKTRVSRRTYGEQMAKLSAFSEELESLRKLKSVDQVVVMSGHNCGGLPTPGKPYTVQAIQGWQRCTEGGTACIDPCRRYRRGLQVDSHYTKLLEDVVREGFSIQIRDKIPAEAKLKGYFELDGIASAILYFLGLHAEELIFVAVGSRGELFADRDKLEINDRITTMRALVGSSD